MSDRELLEAAANAAGYGPGEWFGDARRHNGHGGWNALTDDGDAFRLAVKLRLYVRYHEALGRGIVNTISGGEYEANVEDCGHDPCAATRRAIVRAAAAIGESAKATGAA